MRPTRPKILIIREGAWLVCPDCKQKLATFTRDVWTGCPVEESLFCDPQAGAILKNYYPFESPCCKAPLYFEGKLSTDLGWLPDDLEQMN